MPQLSLNWLPIFIAAVVNMAFGAAWYSQALFGRQWLKAMGWSHEEVEARKKNMGRTYLLAFAASLVMAAVLQHFIYFTGAETAALGAKNGLWVWLGFVAPVMLGGYLWEGKSLKLYKLNAGYYLISLIIQGAFLAVWR
ncbi:DUF1761 domain-containing protein [Candidatus Parcubacteria bacterium]|nr:DUF1761 domain-containing protein [Candidatus Parcubacteria bacterium]